MTMLRQAWARVREVVAEQAESQERLVLVNRPWAEEYLHWSPRDGTLHGELMPPPGWRRYSVTRGGWCQHGRNW